jgi:hypothetical protein
MTERIMNIDALQAYFITAFSAKQVRVCDVDDGLLIKPVKERTSGSCSRVRGLLADCPEMSVDKFLERKRADKELDL